MGAFFMCLLLVGFGTVVVPSKPWTLTLWLTLFLELGLVEAVGGDSLGSGSVCSLFCCCCCLLLRLSFGEADSE